MLCERCLDLGRWYCHCQSPTYVAHLSASNIRPASWLLPDNVGAVLQCLLDNCWVTCDGRSLIMPLLVTLHWSHALVLRPPAVSAAVCSSAYTLQGFRGFQLFPSATDLQLVTLRGWIHP